ncbi:MAG: riboflavin synthase [Bacteroidales bacterium]|nr:riboflavin synthase [Bacteroidales bacterium]
MFTGIVERTAQVVKIEQDGTNFHFTMECEIADELHIDQSFAHDGCCLTVVKIDKEKKQYVVTAMKETMDRTNLKTWAEGTEVNVERSMLQDGRFDGHIVQGHVDNTAVCTKITDENGSWRYYFKFQDKSHVHVTVEKGSICVNGVSLTVVDSGEDDFSVSIIPYTQEHTNFHNFKIGTIVNIEFDVLGKYIEKLLKTYIPKQ